MVSRGLLVGPCLTWAKIHIVTQCDTKPGSPFHYYSTASLCVGLAIALDRLPDTVLEPGPGWLALYGFFEEMVQANRTASLPSALDADGGPGHGGRAASTAAVRTAAAYESVPRPP
ncbi:hypothetical protein [Nonomuraea sp. NPDC049141]|uniref:hypothetical protein n=1 Tax=Nonomuraea sp. NPDC049141 TaxID=3155500 RepID=UPI0033C406D4